jgi:hypothetical protein
LGRVLTVRKTQGWETRLDAVMVAALAKPFVWGTHDCGTFAAECIDAQCETGLAQELRDAAVYASAEDAALLDLKATVSRWLGPKTYPINRCTKGDIVLYADDEGDPYGLAVYEGQQIVAPHADGLKRVNMRRAICGWRVG